MGEHKDDMTQALRGMHDRGEITGMPKEPPEGFSKNARAEQLLGLRRTNCIPFDQPCELGYHCPLCEYPQVSTGPSEHYDERLHWSEYESMIWCSVCNLDYPSCLCLPASWRRASDLFLASVGQAVARRDKPKPATKEAFVNTSRVIIGEKGGPPRCKFWMVYRYGEGTPNMIHETPETALTEAKRLCLKEGARFVVLEAMALVEPAEAKVSNLGKHTNG